MLKKKCSKIGLDTNVEAKNLETESQHWALHMIY